MSHDVRPSVRDVDGYREYVSDRLDGWRRTAYRLCGNWHTAEDLVSTAVLKILRHWARVSAAGNPDAYVRRILIRTLLDERRRARQVELPVEALPEHPGGRSEMDTVTDRRTLVTLLAVLPPSRQRILVLRYVHDLSVEETAAYLGCSPGNVKSQTARALSALRSHPGVTELLADQELIAP
ncbi:RNA polymerase sigma24 factor [Actinoplanes cyaneus]|uniref:RNA polymerase sigma24 factor n=1 Tax=Actinoplanes cyaneus TaxID=52696 RepID=A0A919MGZ6_9ACTN|nr:SigE family RNA polymerase sigma factor [Actinoplanes cyaneus]MCW2144070.1 RNA polymerase sigma-70 factor, sigma-E family [Actinoplanes cyaneus]GID70761.1 RNA polymerase sigma24 factor [Actinoplanes cyaneus]